MTTSSNSRSCKRAIGRQRLGAAGRADEKALNQPLPLRM